MNTGEIQRRCRFVLFEVTKLPAGLELKEESFREETEASESTFRQVYEGSGRTMIMKQFLYDWAPPAYDYPSLWRDQICFSTDHYATSKQFLLGPHEFVFKGENASYLLLIKPAPWTTREWAFDLYSDLIPKSPT